MNNTPKLRFPEFEGEWKNTDGENVFRSVSNKLHNSDLPLLAITQEHGAIPRDLINYNISVTDKSVDSYKIVEIGNFIISLRSFQGGIEYSNYKGICSPAYIILEYIVNINEIFFKYYFKTPKYIKRLTKNLEGIRDGKMISFKYFSEAKLTFPSIPEQTKIAEFFTAIDQKISELKKKKDLLDQYKKGVMQKIFSQELRFKDDNGNDFPDWEQKKLGENAVFFSGGTPLTTNRNYYIGTIPFIKSGEISSDFTEQFISDEAIKNSSAKIVQKGDLLYALYGATSGEASICKIKGAINQAVLCVRSEIFHNIYLVNYLKFYKQQIIEKFLQGGQGNLSADIVKNLILPYPNIEEQTKIANFLSAIDEKINHCQKQIEQSEQWKKGLLQRMFV